MRMQSFHLSTQGASHIKKNKECQDASESYYDERCAIAIVCDGHGGDDYVRSASGSAFACAAAKTNILNFIENVNRDELTRHHNQLIHNLKASIISAWNEAVYEHYEANPFTEAEIAVLSDRAKRKYLQEKRIESAYGTTLIAVACTKDYWFGIHIGDGKCVAINPEGKFVQPIPWDEKVYPTKTVETEETVPTFSNSGVSALSPAVKVAKPKVLIPVFPGTNCEYDSARAMMDAGADAEIAVIRNLTAADVQRSVEDFAKKAAQAQMIFLPGGFSGGDEPDGSAKFITAFFRNPAVKEQVMDLLKKRDGLMLGICNGFQALIKLGLVPYGKIIDTDDTCPTLTYNIIGRHQSKVVHTRICSNKSPWLAGTEVGQICTVPISHGEGRFFASQELVQKLAKNGQIATQYVDLNGNPTMDTEFNPNGSVFAIEGITSPDGRVFGKMGHSERIGKNLYRNVPGEYDIRMFQSAVKYFK